jgi:hypothetical protein
MSQVRVWTEACYMKRGYLDETPRLFITADKLVEVLNSCREDGPDREYVLSSVPYLPMFSR